MNNLQMMTINKLKLLRDIAYDQGNFLQGRVYQDIIDEEIRLMNLPAEEELSAPGAA